jgi:acetolactate synthase-1/2/3 large subunit
VPKAECAVKRDDQPNDIHTETLADALAGRLVALGVTRMFGVPGGGSSLEVIEAAGRRGIDFVLARTETGAALMAAVTAELTGVPGVVLTGVGPGAASVVNGVAYASLERAPLIVLTDCADGEGAGAVHQAFDQPAALAPLTKGSVRLTAESGLADFDDLVAAASRHPLGPVHVDISAAAAQARVAATAPETREPAGDSADDLAELKSLLAASSHPVLIAGLQARRPDVAPAVRSLADALSCPVLVSYKAAGAIDTRDPGYAGPFTGAVLEGTVLSRADLIITAGLDSIEPIPAPWPYEAPVAVLLQGGGSGFSFAPAVQYGGDLTDNLAAAAGMARKSAWTAAEIAGLRSAMARAVALTGAGHTADTVVVAVADTAPESTRLSVDAGAHMISAMARWPARAPLDVLKSNGLSTMGYAVPAAIASALAEPDRRTVAITGDGGLMMCLAELSTAARLNLPVVVVVVNDAALSLIDIKQRRRQFAPSGVSYPPVDFARAAEGLGCRAWPVGRHDPLDGVLHQAFAHNGPSLIDVAVDPSGYGAQLAALRG